MSDSFYSRNASSNEQEPRPGMEEMENDNHERLVMLAEYLYGIHGMAFLLVAGSMLKIVGSLELGRVFAGIMQIVQGGTAGEKQISWHDDIVRYDRETEGHVQAQLGTMNTQVGPPFALVWQSACESHPHLTFSGYSMTEVDPILWTANGVV